jgi:hypothetical protein
MKVVRLSALSTGHLYPPGNIPGTHLCWSLNRTQGHNVPRMIMSKKNYNDTTLNQTCDLPSCKTVPQTTAPLRALQLFRCSCTNLPRDRGMDSHGLYMKHSLFAFERLPKNESLLVPLCSF